MVTDRVGPTITTLKAEVDYLDGEVKKLLNLLADARTESMKLRAALHDLVGRCMDDFNGGRKLRRGDVDRARAALEGK